MSPSAGGIRDWSLPEHRQFFLRDHPEIWKRNPEEEVLIPITKGEAISAGAFTEPDHGSDITSLQTTAVKDEKGYVINGVKTFISNGRIADFVIVLCQTNPRQVLLIGASQLSLSKRGAKGLR